MAHGPEALREVKCMVRATNFEQRELYRAWHKRIASWDSKPEFQPDSGMFTIGQLDGRPIVVAVRWVRLDGHLVGFYNPTSQVVDYVQVDAWIEKSILPPVAEKVRSRNQDAKDFVDCLLDLGIPLKS